MTEALATMTQTIWNSLSAAKRDQLRSNAGLSRQLIGLEGHRVEVVDHDGGIRRFIVGRSTGWIPCHTELKRRTSTGGVAANKEYRAVRDLGSARK